MKKSIFTVIAAVALVACNNDQIISRPESAAIKFDNLFVENSTRANDITGSNLANFGVFASVVSGNDSGVLFNNMEVTKAGNAYTYSPAQYWVSNASYNFAAIAPYNNGTVWSYDAAANEITFNNDDAEANMDLLFAQAQRTTGDDISNEAAVALDFNHLLSRVKFTFTNGFADGSNIELEITDVTITDAYAVATYENQVWAVSSNSTFAHNFGLVYDSSTDNDTYLAAQESGSTEHFYFIPTYDANDPDEVYTYDVEFTVSVKQAGVEIKSYERETTLTLNMQQGYSYNVNATVNDILTPITFTVSVDSWDTPSWDNTPEVGTQGPNNAGGGN